MNDWIMWGGGVCPVPKGTKTELRFRDRPEGDDETTAPEEFRWSNKGLAMDIVAYRVIDGFFAVDGVEYPYGCGAKVPPGREIAPCRPNPMNICTHWRLKAREPIEVALQAAADDEPDDPSLLESPIVRVPRVELERLRNCSDREMRDGDTAREMSEKWLAQDERSTGEAKASPDLTSIGLLSKAKDIQAERAREYEQAGGERSTAKIVAAFNAITGRDLRESEGWLFLQLLKMVRGEAKRTPHMDSIVDNVSYAALYGEARAAGR